MERVKSEAKAAQKTPVLVQRAWPQNLYDGGGTTKGKKKGLAGLEPLARNWSWG